MEPHDPASGQRRSTRHSKYHTAFLQAPSNPGPGQHPPPQSTTTTNNNVGEKPSARAASVPAKKGKATSTTAPTTGSASGTVQGGQVAEGKRNEDTGPVQKDRITKWARGGLTPTAASANPSVVPSEIPKPRGMRTAAATAPPTAAARCRLTITHITLGLVAVALALWCATATATASSSSSPSSSSPLDNPKRVFLYDEAMVELGECYQPPTLVPVADAAQKVYSALNEMLSTGEMKERAVAWLSGAVKFPTETYDNMGEPGEDARWSSFEPFQAYINATFPLVHAKLRLTKINTYGLIYEWEGSNKELKPVMLAAHQDVVPVDASTASAWTHPPFSGYYDRKRVWGRGTSDDKSGMIGSLAAVELLLAQGFTPTRPVVLAFGFDEEASGFHGAGRLAGAIEERWGEKGIAMIVDEGAGFYNHFGNVIALPGVAEKGLYNVRVEVQLPGGHSSVAPDHTSIGILADILHFLEAHPIPPRLDRQQPIYHALQCVAKHAEEVPSAFRKAIRWSLHWNVVLRFLSHRVVKVPLFKSIVGTTQAIDMIRGGVKSNALPENAWAVVNHRVSATSSLGAVQKRYAKMLKPFAAKHNMTFTAFDKVVVGEGDGTRALIVRNATLNGLEPAPRTPTGRDAAPYQVLAGSIKATYKAQRGLPEDSEGLVVAPGMMTGNTDTRYYWRLTDHIFRYNHYEDLFPEKRGVHTVNEYIEADTFVEMIRFFATLIMNADESVRM